MYDFTKNVFAIVGIVTTALVVASKFMGEEESDTEETEADTTETEAEPAK